MARWVFKAAVQRGLAMLPLSHVWNELFQTYVTRSLKFTPDNFTRRLAFCRQHLEYLRKFRPAGGAFTAFDLGTGWFPVVPVGLALCGAERTTTCDIRPLLKPHRVRAILQAFVESAERGELVQQLPALVPERVDVVRGVLADPGRKTPAEWLSPLGIEVLVKDAQHTGLAPNAFDLFVSTEVLEYIPAAVLGGIFTEFRRLARPGAVMSHLIDMTDEYWYFDRSITPFNFLRFSPRAWGWINNDLIPLTRLRVTDFRRLVSESGFRLVAEDNVLGQLEDLQKVSLAEPFKKYSTEELLVLRSWMAATLA
jgi:hypothetical protein